MEIALLRSINFAAVKESSLRRGLKGRPFKLSLTAGISSGPRYGERTNVYVSVYVPYSPTPLWNSPPSDVNEIVTRSDLSLPRSLLITHWGHTGHLRIAHKTERQSTDREPRTDRMNDRAAFRARPRRLTVRVVQMREKRQRHDARTTSDRLRLSRRATRCYQSRQPSSALSVRLRLRIRDTATTISTGALVGPSTDLEQSSCVRTSPSAADFTRSSRGGRAQQTQRLDANFSSDKRKKCVP